MDYTLRNIMIAQFLLLAYAVGCGYALASWLQWRKRRAAAAVEPAPIRIKGKHPKSLALVDGETFWISNTEQRAVVAVCKLESGLISMRAPVSNVLLDVVRAAPVEA